MAVGKPLVLPAAILLASASGALAQTGASPPAATGTPSTTPQGMPMSGMAMGSTPGVSGCMPMMGMMQMMMGQNSMAGHIEGRIAFLKTELKITDAQSAAWNAFADALRANAKSLGEVRASMVPQAGVPQQGLVDRLALQEKWLAARLEGTRAIKSALTNLVGTLSDEQKEAANELLVPHMGMGAMAMMGGMQSGQMAPGQMQPGMMMPGQGR